MAIVTITGTPGSGKSTLAKLLAKRLGYKHYSMGDLQRKLATERGMTINELNKANFDGVQDTDTYVDAYQTELGEKEENFIIDSRIGFHFIPHSIKLFVDAEEQERARRLVERGSASDSAKDVEHAAQLSRERVKYETERYLRIYNTNPYNMNNYDFILDSTRTPPEGLVAQVLAKFPELKPTKPRKKRTRK